MKKTFTILAATTMLLLGSSKLQAQCNINYTPIQAAGFTVNTDLAQSFTATCSGILSDVKFYFDGVPSISNSIGLLDIRLGDNPAGTLIASENFNTNIGQDAYGYFFKIILTNVVPVSSGSQYTFVISNQNFLFQRLKVIQNGQYSGGLFYYKKINGFIGNGGYYDWTFDIHISSACTPTTSTTTATICTGGSYSFNGATYNAAGIYVAHLTNAAGCDSAATLNLSLLSALPAITGSSSVCAGSTITLSNTQAGGVWSTQATSQATINASTGVITALNAGTITFNYTYTLNGCKLLTTKNVVINPIPGTPTINYAAGTVGNPQAGAPTGSFCANRTFTVVGTPAGGAWSSTGVLNVTTPAGVVTTGLIAGAGSLKYTYTSAAGCSNSRTMVGNVFICAARGVATNEKLETTNEFSMYPNPAKKFIRLNVETLIGKGSIVVTDLYGKAVKTQNLSMGNNTIDIANLSKGFYLVSVITSEGKTTKKLVVE